MIPRLNVANNAQTTLNGAVTNSATTITVTDVSLFPAVPFRITVDAEIMEVSAVNVSSKQFTVLRAQEGTVAATHNSGAFVENRWTKGTYDELVQSIKDATTYQA